MKKTFRQALDFLLFSNVFMALCAVAQALVTYKLLRAKPDVYVLGLLFCATLAVYNFSILLSKPKQPQRSPYRRVRWFFLHNRLMISLTIVVVLSLLPLAIFMSTTSLFLLFFLGIISIAYNLPIFKIEDRSFGLRNIPGIKLFLIALVWSLSCVILPILELESHGTIAVSSREATLLLAKRFLFIAALAIPFDLRDLFRDKRNDLKTIPVIVGEQKALLFCQLLLVLYLVLLFLFTNSLDSNFLGLMFTVLLAGWLIFKSGYKKNEYYYFFYLDGILIMQYLILEAFSPFNA